MRNRWSGRELLLCALALLGTAPLRACDTPVYRYALENWPADFYRAAVLHRGPLGTEARQLVAHLKDRAGEANLTVQVIDLAQPPSEDFPGRWRKIEVALQPAVVVGYPAATKIDADAWRGPLTREAVTSLLDSSARRALSGRLMTGEVVWLLVESGDKKRDDAAALVVTENRSAPPESSLIRLRRDDSAETVLVGLLLGSEPDLAARNEPIAFPVFGRGRVLYALVGAGITAENVRRASAFLGGDCSCTVKRDSPGTDLLLTADWSDVRPGGDPVRAESIIAHETETGAEPAAAAGDRSGARAALWVAATFAGGLVLLTGTLALRSRKAVSPPPG
jgi:hypothetical protein